MTNRCLADIGGPFYDLAKPFRNWSALPFYQLDLSDAPYVDLAQLAAGVARAETYLAQIHAQGYTGIVVDNLAHFVGFEHAPVALYLPESPYAQRAAIYRATFAPLFSTAARLGMEVFVTCDMQWSTPPLRDYIGPLVADNPRVAAINRWAMKELFTTLPQVSGLFIRVGETGGAHDLGSDYAGHMLYTTADSLRTLLHALLPVCEQHDRLLVLRTWSIGIGELGDLMWSPERYRAVFAGFDSPHLLASIKHGPSDFFRMLPHNPTLGLPGPQQIIEVQNRREYELFGMVPSSVAGLHQGVLQHAATHERHAGVWAWNSSGGWGGGTAALGSDGWSIWTVLSSALTSALTRDAALDTAAFVQHWCAGRFGTAFGAAVADVYLESGELIERGWYPGQLTQAPQSLGAMYLPSLLWVWWMRPTASGIIWAYLAATLAERATAIPTSAAARDRLAQHAARLQALAPDTAEARFVVESARYLHSVIAVAHAVRAVLLPAFVAAAAGNWASWRVQARMAAEARAVLRDHHVAWSERADFPPLELGEIDSFLRLFARAPRMVWPQARAAGVLVAEMLRGRRLDRKMYAAGAGAIAMALLVFSLARKYRLSIGAAGALASMLAVPLVRQRAVRTLLPWLSRRFYLLPSIFFETGPSFTEWTA